MRESKIDQQREKRGAHIDDRSKRSKQSSISIAIFPLLKSGRQSGNTRTPSMNRFRHFSSAGAVAVLCALSFAACDTPDPARAARSRFTGESQSNLINETSEPTGGRTKPDYDGRWSPEGIAKAHGHYYYVRNGAGTILTKHSRFMEGVTFDPGGKIMLADGSYVKLLDGDMVTFAGDRIPMPPSTRLP